MTTIYNQDTTLDLNHFLETTSIPGNLVYAKVWGSHSHNCQLPESDIDYLAVYQLPTHEFLGLSSPNQTVDGKGPDFQAHELGKFCTLLLKGNPAVVECLFTERMQVTSDVWLSLRARRGFFLNRKTLNQYLGYCENQLHRLDTGTRLHSTGGTYNTKWAYHLIRIAQDALRIANGQAPLVWKEGLEQELLMRIRAGMLSPEEVVSAYTEIKKLIVACTYDLPEKADEQLLDTWLLKVRLDYLDYL